MSSAKKDDDSDCVEEPLQDKHSEVHTCIQSHPKLLEIDVKQMPDDDRNKLEQFQNMAKRLVATHVVLVPETLEDAELLTKLKASRAGSASGTDKAHVLIAYDQQEAGEPQTSPHLRIPPMRSSGDHLRRLLKIALRRKCPDSVADGDLYCISDAGRAGTAAQSH